MGKLAALKRKKAQKSPLGSTSTPTEPAKASVTRRRRNPSPTTPQTPEALEGPYEAPTGSPLDAKGASCEAAKASLTGRRLRPYPDDPKYSKPPQGRCECCERSAKHWYVAEVEPGWKYFHNGVQYAGPAPSKFCTVSCAKQLTGSKVNRL